jgi:uncharacterized membrane protein YjfL (UPF0719 family)
MDIFNGLDLQELVATVIYVFLGTGLFGLSWVLIEWITPFSLRRELETEKNLAIAVLMGAMFIALAIIVAAVIRS